jgi:hypothetical protein
MSRIDSTKLNYRTQDPLRQNQAKFAALNYAVGTVVWVFATNYNVLRIMSGRFMSICIHFSKQIDISHATNRKRWVREHPTERQNELTTLVFPRRLYSRTAKFSKCLYNGASMTVDTNQFKIKLISQVERKRSKIHNHALTWLCVKTVGYLITFF